MFLAGREFCLDSLVVRATVLESAWTPMALRKKWCQSFFPIVIHVLRIQRHSSIFLNVHRAWGVWWMYTFSLA